MDRAAAFHEAKWRMYKRRQNYEKAKHHARVRGNTARRSVPEKHRIRFLGFERSSR